MKKICVLISGTNRSGKTTTASRCLGYFGGINNDSVKSGIYESVDGRAIHFMHDKSKTPTTNCSFTVKGLIESHDVIFMEGMYLGTFGAAPLQTIFQAEKQLYVFLFCSKGELEKRAALRPKAFGNLRKICQIQRNCLSTAQKMAKIGIPVICFDSGKKSVEEISEAIIRKIELLTGENFTAV